MVNAWEVTRHWDGHHLQAASAKLLKDFAGIGVDFKKMRPRQVAEQLGKVQKQGKDVFRPVMDRARYVFLSRSSSSLASLRSGVRQWHVFAVSVLHYKVDLSAPPRSSEHVLCWLSCFTHHGTAMNYLGYLKNFCEIEGFYTKLYNESVRAWRKGAQIYSMVDQRI